jgi:probable rRNA maturation factor
VKLTVEILDETRSVSEEQLRWLSVSVDAAARRLRCAGEVRVRVVGDTAMAAAHEEFAGVGGTTDVLTFDMSDPEAHTATSLPTVEEVGSDSVQGMFVLDTDVLVCLDEGIRQAASRGYPFERELLLYVLHGILHCLGFDDHEQDQYDAMHAMEDSVLAAIGVGSVFHRPFVGEEQIG